MRVPNRMTLPMMLCVMLFTALQLLAQTPARQPAVLFAGTHGAGCGFQVANKLAAAGFALNALPHPGLNNPFPWEKAKRYNVIAVSGIGRANADLTLPDLVKGHIATLNRFLQEGGGLLVFGSFGQMVTDKMPQDAFLIPLGLTPLFEEAPFDPDSQTVATSWKLPFALTKEITPSPVTAGMQSLWYPVPAGRPGAQNHVSPFKVDNNWTVVVRGAKSSFTKKGVLQQEATDPGTYAQSVPLVAMRAVGKGRIVYLSITPEYLTGAHAMTTLEDIVLERGLRNTRSDGYQLLENCLKWLAEPSATGDTLGGATNDAAILRNPFKIQYGNPYSWPEAVTFPAVEPAYPGVIGARTRYSSGTATADQWAVAAKERGLAFIVFLEELGTLTPENFTKLKADCARLSSTDFSAIPGITIDDEVGNHYFYCGSTLPYPDKKFLSEDGKVFRARDPALGQKDPYIKGQLAMTTLDYAYSLGSFKLTAGNYLFSQDAAPFADFFSDWDAIGVITAKNGQVIEDATEDYLKIVDSGQGPLPLAITLMDSPSDLAKTAWRTVLRFPAQGTLVGGVAINPATKIRDYFSEWHFYPDNPSKIYVTSGPEIELWCFTGHRDYGGDNRGDFVWQNYRWQLRGKVSSKIGLKEVCVYDGPVLFRRFLPGDAKEFEFTLDMTHDQQHNLALVATDIQGNKAVSGEQWDRNHRLEEFQCSDRNNQLSYGMVVNKNDIGILLGGNQSLGTPLKRIASHISPPGTFKNDGQLGAPAFDGGAGGEPDVIETTYPLSPAQKTPTPNVNEARRLLHTGDVHIGDGAREHYFTDDIGVFNVWHTLWRTAPSPDYTVTRRNHFFNINPDSPLAVFLWDITITLKNDLPNKGFQVGLMRNGESKLWALRGSDNTFYSGTWEENIRSNSRYRNTSFGKGAYAAFLDSPLGGCAVLSLTDGLEASLPLPGRNSSNLSIALSAANAPQAKGESRQVQLLMVGIPRSTDLTKNLPAPTTEVIERFYRDFGIDGGKTGYSLQATAGTILDQRYILAIDGGKEYCFSGKLSGNLISSLPITVANLRDNWSSVLYDRAQKKARPLGMFEKKAWATVSLMGNLDLFIGHPIIADNPEVTLQVTQSGENAWRVEAHNPTAKPMTVTIRINPRFDPLAGKPFTSETLAIPAGSSVWRTL
ncbi:MAG: hypothetical protein ACYC7E_16595 [Armatimonadota bacterium]